MASHKTGGQQGPFQDSSNSNADRTANRSLECTPPKDSMNLEACVFSSPICTPTQSATKPCDKSSRQEAVDSDSKRRFDHCQSSEQVAIELFPNTAPYGTEPPNAPSKVPLIRRGLSAVADFQTQVATSTKRLLARTPSKDSARNRAKLSTSSPTQTRYGVMRQNLRMVRQQTARGDSRCMQELPPTTSRQAAPWHTNAFNHIPRTSPTAPPYRPATTQTLPATIDKENCLRQTAGGTSNLVAQEPRSSQDLFCPFPITTAAIHQTIPGFSPSKVPYPITHGYNKQVHCRRTTQYQPENVYPAAATCPPIVSGPFYTNQRNAQHNQCFAHLSNSSNGLVQGDDVARLGPTCKAIEPHSNSSNKHQIPLAHSKVISTWLGNLKQGAKKLTWRTVDRKNHGERVILDRVNQVVHFTHHICSGNPLYLQAVMQSLNSKRWMGGILDTACADGEEITNENDTAYCDGIRNTLQRLKPSKTSWKQENQTKADILLGAMLDGRGDEIAVSTIAARFNVSRPYVTTVKEQRASGQEERQRKTRKDSVIHLARPIIDDFCHNDTYTRQDTDPRRTTNIKLADGRVQKHQNRTWPVGTQDEILKLFQESLFHGDMLLATGGRDIKKTTFVSCLCACVKPPRHSSCDDPIHVQLDELLSGFNVAIRTTKALRDALDECPCQGCKNYRNPLYRPKVLRNFFTASNNVRPIVEHTFCPREAQPEYKTDRHSKVPCMFPRACTDVERFGVCSKCGIKNLNWKGCPVMRFNTTKVKFRRWEEKPRTGEASDGTSRTQKQLDHATLPFKDAIKLLMEYINEARPHINDTYWTDSAIENVVFRLRLADLAFIIDYAASQNLESNRKLNSHECAHNIDHVMIGLSNRKAISARVKQDDGTTEEVMHHSYNVSAGHCFADTIGKGKKNDAAMSFKSLKAVITDRFEVLLRDLDTLMETCWLISDNCKAQYKCWRSMFLEGRLSFELLVVFAIIYIQLLRANKVSQKIQDQLASNEVRTPLVIETDANIEFQDRDIKAVVDTPIDVLVMPNLLAKCEATGGLNLMFYALRSRNRALCRLNVDAIDFRHPRGLDNIPRDLISLSYSHCTNNKILPFNWEGQFGFDVRHLYNEPHQGKGIHDSEGGVTKRHSKKLETSGIVCGESKTVFVNLSDGIMGAKDGVKQVIDLEALRIERGDKLVSRVRPNTVSERTLFLASEDSRDAVRLYEKGYRNSLHIDRKTPHPVFKSIVGSSKFKEIFFPKHLSGKNEFFGSSHMCGCKGCYDTFDCPTCIFKPYRVVKKYALKKASTPSGTNKEEIQLLAILGLSKITKAALKTHLKSWNVPFPAVALKHELVSLLLSAVSPNDTTTSNDMNIEEYLEAEAEEDGNGGENNNTEAEDDDEDDKFDDGDDMRTTRSRGPDLNCIGLENFGNTCWMNAVTQLLSASAHILSNEESTDCNPDHHQMAAGLSNILWQLNSTEPLTCISLRKVKQELDECSSNRFKTGMEHDAQEYLLFLMDIIPGFFQPFHFQVRINNECQDSYFLSIVPKDNNENSLQELLNNSLDEQEAVLLSKAPQSLFITVHRSADNLGVKFGDYLDGISTETSRFGGSGATSNFYQLRGIVCRTGSQTAGHFFSFVRRASDVTSGFVKCDDSRCFSVPIDDVTNEGASVCILLFEERANFNHGGLALRQVHRDESIRDQVIFPNDLLDMAHIKTLTDEQLVLQLEARGVATLNRSTGKKLSRATLRKHLEKAVSHHPDISSSRIS